MQKRKQNDGNGGCTPRGRPPVSGSKRHKQTTLAAYWRSGNGAEETPAVQPKAAAGGMTTTLGLGLEKMALQTRRPTASLAAPTQGRPAIQEPWRHGAGPLDGEGDDDFTISMSQTYERTQPDPCVDYGGAEQDDPELSLRRTQHYHAAASTQPYCEQRQDAFLATAAGVGSSGDATVVMPNDTAARTTWEASVADASAFSGLASAALLPPELSLEGQGSNQPGDPTVRPAVAANTASDAFDRALSLPDTMDFRMLPHAALPAVSSGPAVTPEFQSSGAGSGAGEDDGTTPPLQVGVPLYSIFNQGKAKRRPIYLVRHGESEFNMACKRRAGFGDPNDIFDARLTPAGQKQARNLRGHLLEMMQRQGDPLFIVSPLTRAIETFLLMLPDPDRLKLVSPGRQGRTAGAAGGSSDGLQSKPVDMVICPTLAELLLTSGDVGRPKSVLIQSFPQIAEQLGRGIDRERWWYEKAGKGLNCAQTKSLSSTEPKVDSKGRIDRFKHFLFSQQSQQPNRPIVLVGHANFFKHLMGESSYMDHCVVTAWAL